MPRIEKNMRCPYGTVTEIGTTADTAILIVSTSLSALFATAGWAYTDLIADISKIKPDIEKAISIQSDNLEMLLIDWLSELLYVFDTQKLLFSKFNTSVKDTSLQADIAGQKAEFKTHEYKNEVKAATWHGLKIDHDAGLYRAQILFDV
jgi:SHS2 domain-containing protein